MSDLGPRVASLAWGIVCLTAAIPAGAETPLGPRIPLVVVNAGVPVGQKEIDAVTEGLDAFLARGPALLEEMGVVYPLDREAQARIEALFTTGEDLFFRGHHREATAKFKEIVDWASTHPEGLLLGEAIRKIVFKSHIHLAVIAAGDDILVGEHLAAATRFRDLSPSVEEFPPWICERFQAARTDRRASEEHLATLSTRPGCRRFLAGDTVGQISGNESAYAGDGVVQSVCNEKSSLIQRVTLSRKPSGPEPVFLSATTLETDNTDLTLTATADLDEVSLATDLLSLLEISERHRLVAIIGRATSLDVWLIDHRSTRPLRSATVPRNDTAAARRAGRSIAAGPEIPASTSPQRTLRPWYRDPAAWTLVGTGVALLGVGAALHSVYGSESMQESIAVAAMVSGGGLLGTGIVLFFIPVETAPSATTGARTVPVIGMGKRF